MTISANLNSAFQNSKTTSVYNVHRGEGFRAYRTIVTAYNSVWCRNLEARFNELTSLPRGWDGYNGIPVSFTCARFAANLLERIFIDGVSEPSLVPGCDGTLQIEWHKNLFDIEIDVLGANNVIAMRFDHQTSREETLELQNDFSVLVTWIEELASERAPLATATP